MQMYQFINKLYVIVLILWTVLISTYVSPVYAEIDASKLLPADQAFVPQVINRAQGLTIQFTIAEGYYLYQSKINFTTTPEQELFQTPQYSKSTEKTDNFFGTQQVYTHTAQIDLPYITQHTTPYYTLTLSYQGCADVGICYPPTQTEFTINREGIFEAKDIGKKKLSPSLSSPINDQNKQSNPLTLSWDTLWVNLLTFFIAGLGLSFTACMYPLLPIISSIIIGNGQSSKKQALALSLAYTQGLAVTYAAIGIFAGLTGALLTVWLQQAWIVFIAVGFMVFLALAMFGLINLQMPNTVQTYFQNQSNRLSGGKISSVFLMGMLSALIIGPCIAPPLAFILGYIANTGDAYLGGLALYSLALGTGIPLIIIGVFGAHFLPKAGAWMQGIKYIFACILLAVAVYLASPFLPYFIIVTVYAFVLLLPVILLLTQFRLYRKSTKLFIIATSIILSITSLYFIYNSLTTSDTWFHRFVSLSPYSSTSQHTRYTNPEELNHAITQAFTEDKNQPVFIDFYADWCISCKEMELHTFNQDEVKNIINPKRFFQVDVTDNTPEQQALLKEYGLFGPPGFFILKTPTERSEALLGFVKPKELIEWIELHTNPTTSQ